MMKSEKLRDLFENKDLIRIVGAHNGLTAKLVEKNGFDGIWASGLEISTSFSVPDANILTMTQLLDVASSMNDVVSIPVIVDCDTGFGNSNNVIHMVKKFEAAGIAAVCIEDKMFPKVNSFISGRQELAPTAEFVGKIMAAKNAQRTEDFMVFARVEALIAGWGQKEAIQRAKAYIDAGADGIFIHSKLQSPREIIDFVNAWNSNIPLIICPTTYPSLTEKEMKELKKVKMVIYANHGIRALIKAVNSVLSEINKNGICNVDDKIAPLRDVFELQEIFQMKENEKKYLRMGEDVRVIIPAAGCNKEPSFEFILQNTPVVMLDINGKSILQRNIEIFDRLQIRDITIVTGHNHEKIRLDSFTDAINFIHHKDYQNTYVLSSIMSAKDKFDGKTLIIYSDIVFEEDIIRKLLKSDADIILVLDRSYKKSNLKNKKLDLVVAKFGPMDGDRVIHVERENPILKIGENIPSNEATHEFVGIGLFSAKGIKAFKNEYLKLKNAGFSGPFHEAQSLDMADFTDMIQELIDKGYTVSSLEINKGWAEIHSFEDYKHVCSMLSNQGFVS